MRGLAVPRTPPEPALLDVVRDLFVAIPLPLSFGGGFGAAGAAAAGARQQQQQPQRRHRHGGSVAASDGGLRDGAATLLQAAFARLPRTAPSESLLARCRSADLLLRSPHGLRQQEVEAVALSSLRRWLMGQHSCAHSKSWCFFLHG